MSAIEVTAAADEPVRLIDRLGAGGLMPSTDDVLAITFPLLEQTLELHEQGRVAPLEGIDDLIVTNNRVWFERAKARPPRLEFARVQRIAAKESHAFDVVAHKKQVVDGHDVSVHDVDVAEAGDPITRPMFLSRYVSWEHEVGHHDPLTDIYVLGLVLASVALDQNLGDRDALARFVEARKRASGLGPRLHPVVARTIVRMTEIERGARAQDLRSLLETLRNYREQPQDRGDTTPPGELLTTGATPRKAIYGRLRDRLFDFSRRNRLLYFTPSNQTVNLTLGSVPLVLDYKNVDPDSIFTWAGRPAADVASCKAVPLSRYLRLEDYPYLASALDQLRLDANRSKTEVGFSPLRLALCFLHWHDLKQAPDVRISSPLLLLPVTLERKKGVRDAVILTAETDQAEVNPVLRQYLSQLYGITLPDHVDASDARAIDDLPADLLRQIQGSEPAVTLTRVDKPRIDLVLAQAKRRLDAYRKRVALSGRHARSHRGFDYSYARSKLHPLGVQMFSRLVYPASAPSRDLVEAPRPRVFHHSPDVREDDVKTVEKETYHLHDGGTSGGPYEWALDLCSVTLANFHYRKMSLVRDYVAMLGSDQPHPAFDALFSAEARPLDEVQPPLPVGERFDVMPADPTQAGAVARARGGGCFIIQGPPGTGKSQTITNLIADYVARGKRVLFVCEKRAAIDVVYHRLRMQGLSRLSCLIHDSQGDKKAFIKDLKESYESWVGRQGGAEREAERRTTADAYDAVLARAGRFRALMTATPKDGDLDVLSLLRRTIELESVGTIAVPVDRLPGHRELLSVAPILRSLEHGLRAVGRDARLGFHLLRLLSDEVILSDNPEAVARREARALVQALDAVLSSPLARVGQVTQLSQLTDRCRFVGIVRPLIDARVLRLLDASSEPFRTLESLLSDLRGRSVALAKAAVAAAGWTKPIARDEVTTALAHARRFDGSLLLRMFGWLSPTWWRLRRVLNGSFDFAAKAVPPTWSEVLERLDAKYAAAAAVDDVRALGRTRLGLEDLDATWSVLEKAKAPAAAHGELSEWLVAKGTDEESAADLLRVADRARDLEGRGRSLLRGVDSLSPSAVRAHAADLEAAVSDLPAVLEALRRLSAPEHARAASLVREEPVALDELERAVCHAAVHAVLRERALDVLGGADWDALKDDAIRVSSELRRVNGEAIVERAEGRFLANVRFSNAPLDGLTREEKARKKQYASGRKELEHEFGKQTRFKSIRDLAAGAAGIVIRDLKPVWLMSPLSVADTLPLETSFDVVIFDEASQIPLEDAVPAAHRGAQTIVVGDEMQLPPTNFFATSRETPDFYAVDAGGYELDAQSLLTHAGRALPSTMLGWHYRSRDEALIAFSNRVFYEGKLLTVPAVSRATPKPAIVATGAKDGTAAADELLGRAISFHLMKDSPYEQRRNQGEARYIAELLRGLLRKAKGRTIGVVAFSEAQQDEIEAAVRDLGEEDPEFRAAYEAELEREEDGQYVGLFVKNLENVQGDERDIIVISVCYGPDARGKMLMNFGPINRGGGEKRLNVIFSRAKHHLAVVSSVRWTAITNEYNDGANCLRSYLRYAEAMSTGSVADAEASLSGYGRRAAAETVARTRSLEDDLAEALRGRGHEVDLRVGSSDFRCNLGVRKRGEDRYRIGILVDDAAQHVRPLDEVMQVQPSVLKGFGWEMMTVLHKDWWADRQLVLRRIEQALG